MREKFLLSAKATAICTLLAGSITLSNVRAQTYVGPTLPDNFLYTTGASVTVSDLNVASIVYGAPSAAKTLMAVVYYGNGNPGGIIVKDLSSSMTLNIAAPSTAPMTVPDVVIGNSLASPTTDYIVATSYLNISMQPQVDYYKVHYTSPGVFTLSPGGSTVVLTTAQNAVHLDVISETNNTSLTGFPFCNKFVVTWGDGTKVYAFHSTLNAPPATVSGGTTIGSGFIQPDVAGIERTVGSTVDSVALFTFTDVAAGRLFYAEWDFNAGIVSPATILDPGSSSTVLKAPRIDAVDDYLLNNNPSISKYKVAAQASNTSTTTAEVRTYDNLLGASHFTVSNVIAPPGWVPPGPYNAIRPCVAYGSFNSSNYTVTHFSQNPATGLLDLFMDPIRWSVPTTIANPPNLYYQVNTGSPIQGAPAANGVCTPANGWDRNTIVAWSTFVSTGAYNIYYKVTNYPYAFRKAESENIGTLKIHSVYPNPASDHIIVSNADGSATMYTITDMAGRAVGNGNMQAGEVQIGTSKLANGTYLLNLYNGNNAEESIRFVKQ